MGILLGESGFLSRFLLGLGGVAGLLAHIPQSLFHCRGAVARHLLGRRPLVFRQGVDQRLAVSSAGTQALGFGAVVLTAGLLATAVLTIASAAAVLSASALAPVPVAVPILAIGRQLGRDEGLVPARSQNFQCLRHRPLLLGLERLNDLDAVHVELSLNGQLVTYAGGKSDEITG